MKTALLLVLTALASYAAELPATNDVVAKFLENEAIRRTSLSEYSVTAHYHLENKSRRADMVVRWTRLANGEKRYQILSEDGDSAVRTHVFHKLLNAEVEASRSSEQERARITPANYSFQVVGTESVDGRQAYIVTLAPKTDDKFLTSGRIWIDAQDYAVIRVEGRPARTVSFWTKSVSFVQTFERAGAFWLVATNHSVTDARLFGLADLTIQYADYRFAVRSASAGE